MNAGHQHADAADATAPAPPRTAVAPPERTPPERVAPSGGSSRPAQPRRFGLPQQLLPQTRPTPTPQETSALIGFVQARLREPGRPDGPLASRIQGTDGLLSRYRRAVTYAAHPPHGLEQAWGLVAATLANEVADLAAAWSKHPDFDPKWIH